MGKFFFFVERDFLNLLYVCRKIFFGGDKDFVDGTIQRDLDGIGKF